MGRIYVGDDSEQSSDEKFYRGKLRVMNTEYSSPGYDEFFVMYCDYCGSLDVTSLKRKRTSVSEWQKDYGTPFIKRLLGKAKYRRYAHFQLYFSCNKCGAHCNYVAGIDEDHNHFMSYTGYIGQSWKTRQGRVEKYATQKASNPLGLREEDIPVNLVLPAYAKKRDLWHGSWEFECNCSPLRKTQGTL